MYIGELAKKTGASPKAIRHYEELGILINIQRSGKYRVYDDHHVTIVSLIKRAQKMGFKLKDIAPLILQKHQADQFPLDFALNAISDRRQELKAEIERANSLDKELSLLSGELKRLFSKT
ncbi:MAG: MerR family transcriptional regulator [Oleiphilaceae bacterium]|nr:MerR family transcriptional regulator [Oleiphilaceae bacterium]